MGLPTRPETGDGTIGSGRCIPGRGDRTEEVGGDVTGTVEDGEFLGTERTGPRIGSEGHRETGESRIAPPGLTRGPSPCRERGLDVRLLLGGLNLGRGIVASACFTGPQGVWSRPAKE